MRLAIVYTLVSNCFCTLHGQLNMQPLLTSLQVSSPLRDQGGTDDGAWVLAVSPDAQFAALTAPGTGYVGELLVWCPILQFVLPALDEACTVP